MASDVQASREDGLSLVEMMVALLIIGVVMSALASVLMTSLHAVQGQEAVTQATAAINDILEEVQRVEYNDAVLCPAEAAATFTEATSFEGENLVLDDHVCGDPDRVHPDRTVTRDGRDYDIRTAITWTDDPADGSGASDDDTIQDIKRIVVDVSWTVRGETRTARNMAFRAPQLLDQLLTGEVTPDDGGKYIQINDDATEEGENNEAFTLRAYAREKLTAVQVHWIDRNGAVESHPMTPQTSDGLVWEYHLHTNFGPFSNGGTVFQFEGTSTTSETATVSARGLFLYDPMAAIPGPTMLVGASESSIQTNFAKVRVSSADGAACPDQSLWIDVEGAIRSDVVQAQWKTGPTAPESLSSVTAPDDVAVRGARFQLDLGGRTDFSTYDSATGTYVIPNATNQVRISVDRVVDATTISKEQDGIPFEAVPAC